MVKRKYANKPNWSRVLKKRYDMKYIKNTDFEGYVSIIYIDKVKEPFIKNMFGNSYYLVDDGYIWLQILPLKGNYCMTAMYGNNKQIIQWYFDIVKNKGVNDDGIPYFDDLFLDVVVLPNSKTLLLDEDELMDALNNKEITKQEFNMAYKESEEIIANIASDINKLINFTNVYLNMFESK